MTNKGWVIFAALVVLLLGGAIYLSRQNQVNVNNVDVQVIQKPVPTMVILPTIPKEPAQK